MYRGEGAPVDVVGVQVSVAGLYRPPASAGKPGLLSPPHTIMRFPVHTAVCKYRAAGALAVVAVGVQVSVAGSYRPPVLSPGLLPHTTMRLPVQTAS